jgi:WD40 repeat protein
VGHSLRIRLLGFLFGAIVLVPFVVQAQTPDTPNWTRALVWSPDGTQIAVATQYGSIRLVNNNGQTLRTLQVENGSPVFALAWSPNSLLLASGGADARVTIWEVASGNVVRTYQSSASINGLSWHPDGVQLAIASSDGTPRNILVWNTATEEIIFELGIPEAFSVAWKPDGSLLAVGRYKEIQVWNPFVSPAQLVTALPTTPQFIVFLDWSSDGSRLASAQTITAERSVVNVWDMNTAQLILTYGAHEDVIRSVVWSPDDKYLASASADGTIRIWDSVSGQTLEILQGDGEMLSVDWNPNGTKVVYGNEGGSIEIKDVPLPSNCTSTISADDVSDLISAANPDNVIADQNTFDLMARGTPTSGIAAQESRIYDFAWSPDGSRIAVARPMAMPFDAPK